MRQPAQRKHRWFPKRELVVRSDGHSRTLTLSSRVQMAAVALLAGAAVASIAAVVSLNQTHREAQMMQAVLANREAQVSDEQRRVTAFRSDLGVAKQRLEKRQDFIERMMDMLPQDGVEANAVAGTHAATDNDLQRIGAALPEARGLARLERRQLAAVAMLTGYAEGRMVRAEKTIRGLGLDPRQVRDSRRDAVQDGMGGPLEKMATEADGSLDSRFERLGSSLSHMAALEQGLARTPQVMPTGLARMTSGFGYRHDPFTGEGAMHAGLDFGGKMGDPILAAAAGTVSFVGVRSGYGNVVEIAHGNGLTTRYAHMSASKARAGQVVRAGEVIGAIGSTGRSTGPHLHFEVRVGDRAINPRPFFERIANAAK